MGTSFLSKHVEICRGTAAAVNIERHFFKNTLKAAVFNNSLVGVTGFELTGPGRFDLEIIPDKRLSLS